MRTKRVSRARVAAAAARQPVPERPQLSSFGTTDSIQNFVSKLGLGTNNQSSFTIQGFNPVTRLKMQLEWAYRGSWLVRMAVDSVAEDMTREGIELGSDLTPEDSAKILSALRKRYKVWEKLCEAIKWGRLYGGAGVYVMIEGQHPETPLRLNTVGEGQFQGLLVLDRWMLDPALNDLVTDPTSVDVGLPKFYTVIGAAPVAAGTKIHHTRFFRFEGDDLPYWQKMTENYWSLSVLEPIYDRLIAFDSVTQGVAQLAFKAHLRTYAVEGLRTIIAGGGKILEGLLQQIAMMRMMQTNEGITLMDTKDTFEAHQYAFGGLAELLIQFGQQISGALQIPLVRLFGQSPTGLNSTGESDIKTYNDGVKKRQEARLRWPLEQIIKVVARSLGVKLPVDLDFTFNPLTQLGHEERATVASNVTSTVLSAFESGLISQATALKELKQSATATGVWSNITDEDIAAADQDPPKPGDGEEGTFGGGGGSLPNLSAPPRPRGTSETPEGDDEVDDGGSFLPRGLTRPRVVRPFLPHQANERRRAMRDAAAVGARFVELLGFPIVIETAAGQPRWDGKLCPGHYGYFEGTLGNDGDAVDVMIGVNGSFDRGYLIEQRLPTGELNQYKVMLGYADPQDAINDFKLVWSRRALGATHELTLTDLRARLDGWRAGPDRIRAVG